jgi:serine/threonine-protein kinase
VTADWTGRVIDGRYAVESVIGAGGMGLVLRARHAFTGATVALKVLKPELELDTEFQQRFLVEARASNAIGHPAIVTVTDAGRAPDGVLYLAMELLVGRPLRIPAVRGELSAADIRRILLELLDVLGAAHAKGFVHRDLKPENVFLAGPNNQLKLLDFGIVKVLDAQLARVRTATGATLGTPAYMAPEQFHDPRGVDARADLWAVGVMMYEMLAGSLPFRAETTHAMLLAIATANPEPIRAFLPHAPPMLEQFFARALCRDRNGRFGTAAEMAQAIAALPLGTAIVPRPVPPIPGRASIGNAETPVAMSLAQAAAPNVATPLPQASMQRPAAAASPSLARVPGGAPAPTDRRKWFIGLGLASLVSIALVIIAVASTRTTNAPSPTPPTGPVASVAPPPHDAAPPDPAAPPIARDPVKVDVPHGHPEATVKPAPPRSVRPTSVDAGVSFDASVPVTPATPNAPFPTALQTTTQAEIETACVAGCKAAAKCGTVPTACVSQCRLRADFRNCVVPFNSCNETTACGMRLLCGPQVLGGTGTCKEAMDCQTQTCPPGNVTCGCNCASSMSPTHANALFALDVCWNSCFYQQPCMNKCNALTNACQRQ